MNEAGYSSPPRSWQAFDIPETSPEPAPEQYIPPHYPDYDFHIDTSRYIEDPNKALSLTHESRLRYTLNTIAETCGASFTIYANPDYREKQLEASHKFMQTEVSLGSEARIKRSDLIDAEAAFVVLLDELTKQNHPAVQLLSKVQDLESKGLSHGEVRSLFTDVLSVFGWQRIKQLFEEQIKLAKEAAKLAKPV